MTTVEKTAYPLSRTCFLCDPPRVLSTPQALALHQASPKKHPDDFVPQKKYAREKGSTAVRRAFIIDGEAFFDALKK